MFLTFLGVSQSNTLFFYSTIYYMECIGRLWQLFLTTLNRTKEKEKRKQKKDKKNK